MCVYIYIFKILSNLNKNENKSYSIAHVENLER